MTRKKGQTNGAGNSEAATAAVRRPKRSYLKQSDVPKVPLSDATRLAQSLYDDFAGKSAAPHQLAMALGISPTSSAWEDLTGASIAYGLTDGGSNAAAVTLTDLGKRIVAPIEEGQDAAAMVEAALKPTILRKFYDRYDRAKFPQERIARNVLAEMGVPQDRLDTVMEIVRQNGEYTGVIHATKGGPFVAVDTPLPRASSEPSDQARAAEEIAIDETGPTGESTAPTIPASLTTTTRRSRSARSR